MILRVRESMLQLLYSRAVSFVPCLPSNRVIFFLASFSFSCMNMSGFNCLDVKKEDVFQEDVQVYTVDGALGDFTDRVTLLKTDTQGFEVEVLSGAIQTLSSGRAENVMAEFDHRLLRTRETALELLSLLINQYHYDCTHLAFAGRPKDAGPLAPFEFLPITSMGAEAFLDYVTASGGYTDLFCSKR